jgi:hypothetical protein
MSQNESLFARLSRRKGKRPILNVPRTPFEMSLELLAAAGLVLVFVILAQAWSALPARVPQHFGAGGQPDGWGSKATLWLFPGISVGISLLLTIVNRFPHTFNYPWPITEQNAEAQYVLARTLLSAMKVEIVGLMTYLEWTTIKVALGQSAGLGALFLPIFLGVMVATTGLYFARARQAR